MSATIMALSLPPCLLGKQPRHEESNNEAGNPDTKRRRIAPKIALKSQPLTFEGLLENDDIKSLIIPFLETKSEGTLKLATRDLISLSQVSKSAHQSTIDHCKDVFLAQMPQIRDVNSLSPEKKKLIEDTETLCNPVKNPKYEKSFGSYLKEVNDCSESVFKLWDLDDPVTMSAYMDTYHNSLLPGVSIDQRTNEKALFSFINQLWGIQYQNKEVPPEAVAILMKSIQTNQIFPILPFLPTFAIRTVVKLATELEKFEILEWFSLNNPKSLQGMAHQAAENGQVEVLKWILAKEHLAPLLTEVDEGGLNIANKAAENGHFEVLEWLNEHPTLFHLIRVKNEQGQNLAHIVMESSEAGRLDLLEWLSNRFGLAYLLEEVDHDGWNIAHYAARDDEDLDVLEWIRGEEQLSYLLERNDHLGRTIAHHAASKDNLLILDWIEEDEDLNVLLTKVDHRERNIAHAAAESDEGKAIAWIALREHLNPMLNEFDEQGRNLAAIAAIDGLSPSHGIWYAIYHETRLKHQILLHSKDLIYLASISGNIHPLEWFANQEVLSNRFFIIDPKKRTFVHHAAIAGKTDTINWLHSNPRTTHLLNFLDHEGYNFLQLAVIEGRHEVIDWVSKNPDLAHFLQSKDSLGRNLVELAMAHNKLNVLKAIANNPNLMPLFNVKWANRNVAHIAAMNGNVGMLQWMSENQLLAPKLKELDGEGINLAHIAATNNRVEVLKWLSQNKKLEPLLHDLCPDGSNLAKTAGTYGCTEVSDWISQHTATTLSDSLKSF